MNNLKPEDLEDVRLLVSKHSGAMLTSIGHDLIDIFGNSGEGTVLFLIALGHMLGNTKRALDLVLAEIGDEDLRKGLEKGVKMAEMQSHLGVSNKDEMN